MRILLVAYDNDAYVSYFPQGIAYIAAALRQAGHRVEIYNQDVYHWPESHLTALLDRERYDVIGLGACGGYYQYRKVLAISAAINKSKQRPFFVLGGHLVSPEPEYFLKKTGADVIVLGEGEETIVDLFSYHFTHREQLGLISGIAYQSLGATVSGNRELIKDIDTIPYPAYGLFPIDHYAMLRNPHIRNGERCMPVLSGRGCTFNCNFCYRMDKGFRPRSAEGIIEEIRMLQKDYAISYVEFSDELLMSSPARTIALNEAFIKAGLNIRYCCNGRLNFATPEVLKVMKRAGCVFINYGVESLDNKMLEIMNKNLTVTQIIAGVENTLAMGISPGLNIIFGNIGETKEMLKKDVEFLLKYDDQAQLRTIRPVTPYPGSPLYYYAIEKGLLKGIEDFYENKHTNSDLLTVNFTDMSDEEFYRALLEANLILIHHYYNKKCNKTMIEASDLYQNKNVNFRGFR